MMARVHRRVDENGRVHEVTAVCDKDLLGKTFGQGDLFLDLDKHKAFYSGGEVSEAEAVELIRTAGNLNLVGKKALKAAKKALKVSEGSVKKIAGVPHLQIYRL